MVASESVALEGTGAPASTATWRRARRSSSTCKGQVHAQQCAERPTLKPCIFEFVYLARPDSVMDGISVYQARLNLGETLAKRVISTVPPNEIDVVIPIPRIQPPQRCPAGPVAGLALPRRLRQKPLCRAAPSSCRGRRVRKKSVRQKLNVIASEFKGRNVLLVDDSIVRGTTSREIVQMARDAGARKVYHGQCRAAGALSQCVRHRHADQRRAGGARPQRGARSATIIGCDALIYQDVEAHEDGPSASLNPALAGFDASCFDGVYVTGDITVDRHRPPQCRPRRAQKRPTRTTRAWHCPTARLNATHHDRPRPPRQLHRHPGRARGHGAQPVWRKLQALYLTSGDAKPSARLPPAALPAPRRLHAARPLTGVYRLQL